MPISTRINQSKPYIANKLEIIVVIDEKLSEPLQQLLTETTFNWKYVSTKGNSIIPIKRINKVSDPKKLIPIVDFASQHNLVVIVVLARDDINYLPYLALFSDNYRIMVYTDNQSAVGGMLKNPAEHIGKYWLNYATETHDKLTDIQWPTSHQFMHAVRLGFEQWLARISEFEQRQLQKKLIPVEQSAFVQTDTGEQVVADCPLICAPESENSGSNKWYSKLFEHLWDSGWWCFGEHRTHTGSGGSSESMKDESFKFEVNNLQMTIKKVDFMNDDEVEIKLRLLASEGENKLARFKGKNMLIQIKENSNVIVSGKVSVDTSGIFADGEGHLLAHDAKQASRGESYEFFIKEE